jgi:hypothetical protein
MCVQGGSLTLRTSNRRVRVWMGMAMREIMSTTPMLNTRGPNTLGRYCTLELGVSSTDTSCKGLITNTQGTFDLSRQLPMCRQPAEMRDGGISVPSAQTHKIKEDSRVTTASGYRPHTPRR